ncbi:hypothetical protein MHYP_G00041370 [Metynnis hypsauchen]
MVTAREPFISWLAAASDRAIRGAGGKMTETVYSFPTMMTSCKCASCIVYAYIQHHSLLPVYPGSGKRHV